MALPFYEIQCGGVVHHVGNQFFEEYRPLLQKLKPIRVSKRAKEVIREHLRRWMEDDEADDS
jgi:hypothetical protein